MQQPTGPPPDLASTPNIKVACRNLTAAAIADNLRQMAGGYLDHDVVDSTKLEGAWDFDLEWTPRGVLAAKGADGMSVFDAVEKQLGLKLELQNVPMESFVVERVNRKPTPKQHVRSPAPPKIHPFASESSAPAAAVTNSFAASFVSPVSK